METKDGLRQEQNQIDDEGADCLGYFFVVIQF
jgi:hypothetical protein